jgi:hypothetical protein
MKIKFPLGWVLFFFAMLYSSQEPFLHISLDGPDIDLEYSLNEPIRLGEIDHLGSISLDSDFIGIQTRFPGSRDFYSKDYKGVLYEFSPHTGGNNEFSHPNASLAIKIKSPGNWQLSVSARVEGNPTVGVDQLLFKQDEQREYTPFTPSPQVIARGVPGIFHLFYDLALRIDRNDKPGLYVWHITYDIITY